MSHQEIVSELSQLFDSDLKLLWKEKKIDNTDRTAAVPYLGNLHRDYVDRMVREGFVRKGVKAEDLDRKDREQEAERLIREAVERWYTSRVRTPTEE